MPIQRYSTRYNICNYAMLCLLYREDGWRNWETMRSFASFPRHTVADRYNAIID